MDQKLQAFIEKYPSGYTENGLECVIFVRKLYPDLPFGLISEGTKLNVLSKSPGFISKQQLLKNPQPGLVYWTNEGSYGHIAIINEVLSASQVRVSESNVVKKWTVDHSRVVDLASAKTQLVGGWRSKYFIPPIMDKASLIKLNSDTWNLLEKLKQVVSEMDKPLVEEAQRVFHENNNFLRSL